MFYHVKVEDDGDTFIWKLTSKDDYYRHFDNLEDLRKELKEYGSIRSSIDDAISVMLGIDDWVQV